MFAVIFYIICILVAYHYIKDFFSTGTMVINSDSDDSSTAKRNDCAKPRYRPQFLDHFERKNPEMQQRSVLDDKASSEYSPAQAALAAAGVNTQTQQAHVNNLNNLNNQTPSQHAPLSNANSNDSNWENNMEKHFQQISAINQYGLQQHQQHLQQQQQMQHQQQFYYGCNPMVNEQQQHLLALNQQQQPIMQAPPPAYSQQQQQQPAQPGHHHLHTQSHSYVDGEFEFLKFLTFDDLNQRLNNIDSEMEKEIEELNKKYNAKRQPIVDAMNAKRKRQQNINNNLIKI